MVNEAMARAYAIFAKSSFCEAQQNMHQLGECAREAGIEERRLLSEARLLIIFGMFRRRPLLGSFDSFPCSHQNPARYSAANECPQLVRDPYPHVKALPPKECQTRKWSRPPPEPGAMSLGVKT
jgi:hypothetical protein